MIMILAMLMVMFLPMILHAVLAAERERARASATLQALQLQHRRVAKLQLCSRMQMQTLRIACTTVAELSVRGRVLPS